MSAAEEPVLLQLELTVWHIYNDSLQVLATDEFWPAQGGKAPEVSQVREALDAILSSSQKGQLI
jgi:hypothetical protein